MSDVSISPAGLRIIKLLVGNPPQTIVQLIRATGVTRTAVSEQLDDLIAAGFVERDTERPTRRGRPRHLFKPTHAALVLLFAGNQRLLVPAIWQAIHDLGDEDFCRKILKRVGRTLADHYNRKITAKRPRDRLRQFIGQLAAEGGLLEVVENDDDRLVLNKRTCPFISMVDAKRSVCFIDQEMMSAVVGRPIRQTACRHNGDPCCRFEIVDD
jgi:DeoR family transcriptional regulator, suf operon transcriptional repressor